MTSEVIPLRHLRRVPTIRPGAPSTAGGGSTRSGCSGPRGWPRGFVARQDGVARLTDAPSAKTALLPWAAHTRLANVTCCPPETPAEVGGRGTHRPRCHRREAAQWPPRDTPCSRARDTTLLSRRAPRRGDHEGPSRVRPRATSGLRPGLVGGLRGVRARYPGSAATPGDVVRPQDANVLG
jgi:hypothetical protein